MTPDNTLRHKALQEQPVNNLASVRGEAPQKKRHSSALLAAARYRSPVLRVSCNTYFHTGLEDTGIGIGFRERGL